MSASRILIVEDEEIVAFDIETILMSLDYEVLAIVASGEEAIALAEKMRPNLVLMDIMLKGSINGVEAAQKIRTSFNIPVVYLTAHTDVSTLQDAKITEPFGYIIKPFNEKELQTTIEIALLRHQAEDRMRQALAKEKELSELRASFISTATHEFRTPLTIIQGSAGLLEGYYQNLMDERGNKHLQRIKTSVNQMTQLIDDVLLICEAEEGQLKFQPTSLDLVEFCHELVEDLQMSVGEKHDIAVTVHGDCTNACMDKRLLQHILTNLLSNGIKYSPNGGRVDFELVCSDGTATFHIRDRGIGIPPENLSQLFKSFYRASNVGQIKGTGLGLHIIKNCVDLHGGEIAVESTVGMGTTFTVILPLYC